MKVGDLVRIADQGQGFLVSLNDNLAGKIGLIVAKATQNRFAHYSILIENKIQKRVWAFDFEKICE